jgi:quinol monooxygenase YgiN
MVFGRRQANPPGIDLALAVPLDPFHAPTRPTMIHVIATITAKPGQRAAILALFTANRPAVLAEQGCVSYDAVIDVPNVGPIQTPLGDNTFMVIEQWETADTLRAHAASAHMAEYARNSGPLLTGRVINVLEPF